MDLADFDYSLPPDLIAQEPLRHRDGARMLVVHREKGSWEDRQFRDLPDYLGPGDCLVLNESRVLPSRLFGRKPGKEAKLEIFLTEALTADAREWTALVKPGRKVRVGDVIQFADDLQAEVTAWGELGERSIRFLGDVARIYDRLEEIGHIPLPPYIHRSDNAEDRERYQTVYARERGSVAAPTAGLHFTEDVLERIREKGADIARATLHVGLGTFQPLHAERVEDHAMHSERYRMAGEAWEKVAGAQRVVGVGTTSVRTIESIARSGSLAGETDIFIYPGFRFGRTGAMLTNFHLPRTSLLLLVCAFAGTELTLASYHHAVEERYRFFSYGDCMLIL